MLLCVFGIEELVFDEIGSCYVFVVGYCDKR